MDEVRALLRARGFINYIDIAVLMSNCDILYASKMKGYK